MPSITRDALYALVWSQPISKIAPGYGLSDRGLGKICKRHGVPVPPRGYWAKKTAGHKVVQPPLPPIKPHQRASITFAPPPLTPSPAPPKEPVPPEIQFERDPANLIIVEPEARLIHPLIRDAAAALRERKPDQNGIVNTPRGCLDLRIARTSARRALRIFQALLARPRRARTHRRRRRREDHRHRARREGDHLPA